MDLSAQKADTYRCQQVNTDKLTELFSIILGRRPLSTASAAPPKPCSAFIFIHLQVTEFSSIH